MNRRDTIIGLLALGFAPFAAEAQQAGRMPRIGVLWHAANEVEEAIYLAALRRGFRNLGYVEGQNFSLENRFAAEQYERFNALAVKLARFKVDVLVAVTAPAALAAQRATSSIPVVVVAIGDPVALKLVEGLAHPGGNITGLSGMSSPLSAKRLQLFKETVLPLSRVALLVNPSNPQPNRNIVDDTQAGAEALSIKVRAVEARTPGEIERAFSLATEVRANGVIVAADAMFWNERERIAALAMRHRLPTMFSWRDPVDSGGLMSYGVSLTAQFQRVAFYVDKILKGAKPADLPVEQPTRFELVINLKTAKALGITVPQSVLLRADEVIE
jgi:putative ABC transport system substrate-binding protein